MKPRKTHKPVTLVDLDPEVVADLILLGDLIPDEAVPVEAKPDTVSRPPSVEQPSQLPPDFMLWSAVLVQLLKDARSSNQRLREDARRYVLASVGVTSEDFIDVCEMAGVDPERVRKVILSYGAIPNAILQKR